MGETSAGCVLFADVSGGTKLYETAGDEAAHQAIDLCLRLFSALTVQHGGRVVKTVGDEVMAVFPDASHAGAAARDIQLGMHDMAPVGKVRLGVRIGMHQGPVVEKGGDVFGDTVNLAARLAEMATRGQIITSLDTVQLLTPIQKMDCRQLYSIPVKGKEKDVPICELMWTDADDATQVVAQRASTDAGTALRLVYRTRVLVVGGDKRTVVLGREGTADLVIADRMASRAHCEIEQRQDKFVLADHSANGTFLSIDGDREIVLRREEFTLRGRGWIAFGQSKTTATDILEFYCE